MKRGLNHKEEMVPLRRIEGQVRGLMKMIEGKRYCVDILIQVHSTIGALSRVGDKILRKHLEGCVTHALKSKTGLEKHKKINEIMELFKLFRRTT